MMRLPGLIHSDSAPYLALPGFVSMTPEQIRLAHEKVTPVYGSNGEVEMLDVAPSATTEDIFAVLAASGVTISAITGLEHVDPLGRNTRYSIAAAPEIGERAINLKPVHTTELLTSW